MATQILEIGLDRFLFGYALPGEAIEANGRRFTFLGEFARRKDAVACQSANLTASPCVLMNGYMHGRRKRGWVVYLADLIVAPSRQ